MQRTFKLYRKIMAVMGICSAIGLMFAISILDVFKPVKVAYPYLIGLAIIMCCMHFPFLFFPYLIIDNKRLRYKKGHYCLFFKNILLEDITSVTDGPQNIYIYYNNGAQEKKLCLKIPCVKMTATEKTDLVNRLKPNKE